MNGNHSVCSARSDSDLSRHLFCSVVFTLMSCSHTVNRLNVNVASLSSIERQTQARARTHQRRSLPGFVQMQLRMDVRLARKTNWTNAWTKTTTMLVQRPLIRSLDGEEGRKINRSTVVCLSRSLLLSAIATVQTKSWLVRFFSLLSPSPLTHPCATPSSRTKIQILRSSNDRMCVRLRHREEKNKCSTRRTAAANSCSNS